MKLDVEEDSVSPERALSIYDNDSSVLVVFIAI